MKKIFLILAMLAFGSASGQQKDIFDIDAHLQKKATILKKKQIATPRINAKKAILHLNDRSQYRTFFSLHNKNGIHILPQDNMPCIIPDMSEFNMPNAANRSSYSMVYKPGHYPGRIPNPAHPARIYAKPGR